MDAQTLLVVAVPAFVVLLALAAVIGWWLTRRR
jgi:hypothetical protein